MCAALESKVRKMVTFQVLTVFMVKLTVQRGK